MMIGIKFLLAVLLVCKCNAEEQTSRRLQEYERSLKQQVQELEPTITGSGCQCLDPWHMNNVQFDGVCGNPTDALLGVYCYVNETTCDYPPYSRRYNLSPKSAARDYCQPSTGKTLGGCECEHEWGFAGFSYPGTCANPSNDPNGRWCIVNPHTCEKEPRTAPDGLKWDYCEGDREAELEVPPTETTLAGCHCLEDVFFRGISLTNCSNPDDDIGGDWCFVDPRTCIHEPIQWHQKGSWDYCTESPGTTVAGCKCRRRWSLFPGTPEFPGTCASVDNDPNGPYCVVEPHTCKGKPAGKIVGSNVTYDYCQEPKFDTSDIDVDTTVNGCKCRTNATYVRGTTQFEFSGTCANPEDDLAGSWCIVDAKTCEFTPQGQNQAEGGGVDYWDYCEPPLAPPTVTGCRCKNFWQYPPGLPSGLGFYGVCGNPNNDPKGDWCEVDRETCTRGNPSQLGVLGDLSAFSVASYYDYCIPGAPTMDVFFNTSESQDTTNILQNIASDIATSISDTTPQQPPLQQPLQQPSLTQQPDQQSLGDLTPQDCITMQQWLSNENEFGLFYEAATAAQLKEILDSEEVELTLFAPTNQAFQKFLQDSGYGSLEEGLAAEPDLLKRILLFHVVPNKRVSQGEFGSVEETLAESPVQTQLSDTGGVVSGAADTVAQIIQEAVDTCNGLIYAINGVLLPQLSKR